MFTFGRDHEKTCEARYVRNPAHVPLLMSVIDAVHDLIDGSGDLTQVGYSIRTAFVGGGAGVWENTAKWLRKTSFDHPEILDLWLELASDSKAETRFRVACFLDEMPADTFARVSPGLLKDRSKRVAEMAAYKSEMRGDANAA